MDSPESCRGYVRFCMLFLTMGSSHAAHDVVLSLAFLLVNPLSYYS